MSFLSAPHPAGCKVCFVALLQSFSHYNIVAQKLVSLLAEVNGGGGFSWAERNENETLRVSECPLVGTGLVFLWPETAFRWRRDVI